MTRRLRGRLAMTLAAIVVVVLAGTWSVGEAQVDNEVARMTEKMKTVCVGRLLVDLPDEAEIELDRARIHGFDIATYVESTEEFLARVANREAQLRSTPDRLGGNKNLELVKEIKTDAGLAGKLFIHGRVVTEGRRANGLESEAYRFESVALEALVHGNGLSFDIGADQYDPARSGNLARLVGQLVPNPEGAIPTEAGYCIDRAYVRDPLTPDQGEQVMMAAWLPSRPDVKFEMMLAAGLQPADQSLLERSDNSSLGKLVNIGRISRLRAAQRMIAGLNGDELVRRFVEDNDSVVYNFTWEVDGKEDDVLVPHTVFMMDTGTSNKGPVPSSLSEGAAVGLWDAVTSSIRFRPAPTMKRIEASPAPPLGIHASAGEICPQSGWWLCGDGDPHTGVLGGQRQYIEKGARMPQALLLPAQTWWERIRGLQPSYEAGSPTSWKLVDKRSRKRISPQLALAVATPATPAAGQDRHERSALPHRQLSPVGSYASTGTPCPASGWWRSVEPNALDGTRWFAQGSLLPPATFMVPPSVFGRANGAPRAIRRRGAWQLVRIAEAEDPQQLA